MKDARRKTCRCCTGRCKDALSRTEDAFYGLFANFPYRIVAWGLRGIIFPFIFTYGRKFGPPRDQLGHQVVGLLIQPGPARERLTAGVFIPKDPNEPIAALEAGLRAVIAAEPIGAKIRKAREQGTITASFADEIVDEAVAKGVITQAEKAAMELAKRAAPPGHHGGRFPAGPRQDRDLPDHRAGDVRGAARADVMAGDGQARASAQSGHLSDKA